MPINDPNQIKLKETEVNQEPINILPPNQTVARTSSGQVGNPSVALSGTVTSKGAYNPYTSGMETVNKGVGVNMGAYAPQNKQKLWETSGQTGIANPDAFYRGADSSLQIKPEFVRTPTAPTPTGAPAVTPAITPKAPETLPQINAPKLSELRASGMSDEQILDSVGKRYGTDSAQFRSLTSELYPSAETLAKKSPEQQELDRKLQEDIKHTQESYILNQSEFEKNKADYTNYDQVSPKYNNAITDIANVMKQTGKTTLSDQDYQQIAARNGISIDEAKDPRKIFDQLQLSEQGKTKTGVGKYESEMETARINNERAKADLATDLKNKTENVNLQLEDVQRQMDQNIAWMEAQGAWTGAIGSSAYRQGIQNAREEGMRTINKLQTMAQNIKTANAQDVARLSEDYDRAMKQAKSDFDYQFANIKQAAGVKLAGLTEKYGIGNTTLSRALDDIQKEYGTKSVEVLNSYLNAQRTIASTMNQNIENTSKLMELENAQRNKGYESYTANNGALLANTTLGSLAQDYQAGKIDLDHYNQLKAVMVQSITNTLSKLGVVDSTDMNTINSLLNQGQTPTQVIAALQSTSKFSGANKDWQYQEINRYNPETGTTEQVPVWINTKTQEIRQAMPGQGAPGTTGTKGTNAIDFIKSKEGFRSQAYQDSTGKWTIGYGFTSIDGRPVQAGDVMDQATADRMLQQKIGEYQNFASKITVPLSESQKAALTSFEYNLGRNIWDGSAKPIIDRINEGDFKTASEMMKQFVYAGGKRLNGLVNRRNEEAAMLLRGDEGTTDLVSKLGRGAITGYGGKYDNYEGLDIGGKGFVNQPVKGMFGTVSEVGDDKYYGNYVVVNNNDGTYTRYSHLNSIDVNVGDKLDGNISIGKLGSTGNATGPHLDITMFDDSGKKYNSHEVEAYLRNYKVPTTQEQTPAGSKQYTATDTALFDKFLSGKDTKADELKLKKLGYTLDDVNAYAQTKPQTTMLTDDQRPVYTNQLSSFRGNQVVKDFESQIGQVTNIASSLGAQSGPGDIAAVYQFMKALDPSSVVRESEFSTAANSAGVVGSIKNMFSKLENGEMLTDAQKKEFAKLTKTYLKNKAAQYDRLYDDMARVLQLSGIPEGYLPARASDEVKKIVGDQQTGTSQKIDASNAAQVLANRRAKTQSK